MTMTAFAVRNIAVRNIADAELTDDALSIAQRYLVHCDRGALRELLVECDSGSLSCVANPVRWAQFRLLVLAALARASSTSPEAPRPRRLQVVRGY